MKILPNIERAVIDERKVRDYLLNPEHAVGRHKARVIAAATGFRREDYQLLIDQIRSRLSLHEAVLVREYHGRALYHVDIPVTGPRGTAILRTGWIYEVDENAPRFTTAFIRRRPGV